MKTFEELKIGETASYSKQITRADVEAFARLTGDNNLIHIDEEYAKGTIFHKKIAHGFLTAGLISKVIGTQLPGIGTIYLDQSLSFVKPVYIDDIVTATIRVIKKDYDKKNVFLETICYNQKDEVVIKGDAIVKAPKREVIMEEKMEDYLKSNNVVFKLVEEEDAEFILELRQNENLNKYIHSTDITVEQQKEWIRNYKQKEELGKEFYFRIDTKEGEQIGFVRVYNINYESKEFTWGSWIMKPEHPKTAVIESALIIYEFAFDYLNMERAVYDVRLENERVLHFHDRFGSYRTYKSDIDQFYVLPKERYYELREEKYHQFIDKKNDFTRRRS